MTVTVGSLPIFSMVASTFAPFIKGVPIVVSFPSSTNKTSSKVTLSPTLAVSESFSIFIESPLDTLYCFPPVFITANSIGQYTTRKLKLLQPLLLNFFCVRMENILIILEKNMEQKNNLFIPASIILAGFAIATGIYLSNKSDTPRVNNVDAVKQSDIVVSSISEKDHILGNPEASVTIVEFSDTECPFCKMFQTTMQTVIDKYGKDGKVAWVYRHFPLDSLHSKARKEAEATECVNELGGNVAFWKMLDTIYAKTPGNNGLEASKLPEFAKEAGVDVEKFNTCLASGKYANIVEANFQDGIKAGAQGTPYSVAVLKNKLSNTAEKEIQEYVLNNGLTQNVTISSTQKEIVLNGALPANMVSAIIDIILK